ncbi:MAG TPA: dihydrofolate reductase family protein [Gemmatimonadaceae bacterium]|nr:dihydrofolate reductase family protein [Gemmatimonadaceae bacterium]
MNQFLCAGLLDEMWLHVAPIWYGDGKRLFEGVRMKEQEMLEVRSTPIVTCAV